MGVETVDATGWVEQAERYLRQYRQLYGAELWLDRVPRQPPEAPESDPRQALSEFQERIQDCQKCRLAQSRSHFVFGVGNPRARLLCIGEAPGREEDLQGEPFVGPAGRLLDRILAAIGFRREEVYIANVIKCRPPSNRDPDPDEVEMCRPYLLRQIDIIQPAVILCLGRVAAQALLRTSKSIGALRGRVHAHGQAQVVVTYHPAALLRDVAYKRLAWEDVQLARRVYDDRVGDKPPMQYSKKRT